MDAHGSNVPAFLTKLWTLIEDPDTNELICWSASGNSFHVFDQGRFAKEVLPKYFKHNNMASFVRQLNMYGFRKVVNIEQGGLVKPEKDDTEFQHVYFIRGQEHLLENIKRKVTNISSVKPEELKVRSDDVSKILNDVQIMKGKQENLDAKLMTMKHENEALWREVASLRQKHAQQQKVVNKLIQFLISLVQSNRVIGVKRKMPLMLNDSSSAHSLPKYSRPFSLEPLQESAALTQTCTNFPGNSCYSPDNTLSSGPIISDITDLAQCSPSPSPSLVERNDLYNHLDRIDSSLDNLQNLLSGQSFSMESSTLLDLFSPSLSAVDLNLPDVEGNLAAMQDLLGSQEQKCSDTNTSTVDTGKQVVQYSAPPLLLVDSNSNDTGDLPVLFDPGDSPFFPPEENLNPEPTDDDPLSLLSSTNLSTTKDPSIS
ncbi:heat shock factor protein 1 isoform X5 [Pristis pectinata]|uniref:heat shock factor protein 1 isoform X5 n=1 Tax=Pristis pectinata TaxID=685728 RepID=UPI00223D0C51|nr:heat shock factor protein 1 isoform X5 [Pristis pectinata]